jgi:hypothetical protein
MKRSQQDASHSLGQQSVHLLMDRACPRHVSCNSGFLTQEELIIAAEILQVRFKSLEVDMVIKTEELEQVYEKCETASTRCDDGQETNT